MVKVAIENAESDETSDAKKNQRSSKNVKSTKKSHWFLKLSMLLVAAVAAAPSVLSLSGSLPALIQKANPKLGDAVSFSRVEMHWWAPVAIMSLKVQDLSQPLEPGVAKSTAPILCEVERVTTIEPLWRIALNAGRGTGVVVKSPRLTLIADEKGTNLDRTMTELFGSSDETSGLRFPFRVTIEDGAVQLRSAPAASAAIATSTPAEGEISNAVLAVPVATAVTSAIADVSEITGTYSTMDTSRWLPAMKLSASIRQSSVQQVTARTASRATRVAANLDSIVSDFPNAPLEELVGTDASGDPTAARIQIHLQPRIDEQGRQAIQIGARDVDMRLIQPLLSMLGMDIAVNGMISGGIDARLAGAELKDGLVGRIMLAGDDVRIRQLNWAADEWLPLGLVNANGAVAIADDGMLIQDLKITTNVAELTGSGELRHSATNIKPDQSQKIELHGTVNLAKVAQSLRKTLAFHDDVTIQSGTLVFEAQGFAAAADDTAANMAVSINASQKGSWQIGTRIDGLEAIQSGQPLKVDSNLRVDAFGSFLDGMPDLSRGRLTADFGTVDCLPDGTGWKISGLVQPASLWQTLRQFADVPQPGIRGDLRFETRLAMQNNGIRLSDLELNSADVSARSTSLTIVPSNPVTSMMDGAVHVEGSGAALRTLMMPWLDAAFLAEQSQVVADLSASPHSDIQINVRVTPTGVASLQRGNVLSVSQTQSEGTARPQSLAQPQNQNQFTSGAASVFVIDEAEINLNMAASNSGSQFDIRNGVVKFPGLAAAVTGMVSGPDGTTLLDLTADTTYDLDILSRRLFAADSGIALSGQGRDVFKLKGDLSQLTGAVQQAASKGETAALQGSGGVKWVSANILGLSVGDGSAQVTLENSLLRTTPIQCSFNGGQLNAMAQYDIAASRLQLGSGSRVEHVQLTPDLCRQWLGYVAPMMADAADVNGQLSLRVERFFWDLNAPQNSDVTGQLTIHEVSATPGSAFASLLQVVDLLRKSDAADGYASRSLTLPEQTVPVVVRQGCVLHEGLMMDLAGYRLKSSGAVGLNQQIQITLDVPLEKGTAATTRSIKVPLRGSVRSPQPDTAALIQNLGAQKLQEQLGVDKLQDKIGNGLDDTLNKGLNKLLNRF